MLGMSDDDSSSRDSGICVMDEGAATCFSMAQTTSTMDEVMEVDETMVENNLHFKEMSLSRSTTIRREKSMCHVRLTFGDSPTSRKSEFARPALTVRNQNRKRSMEEDGEWVPAKMEKHSRAFDHYHLESMNEMPDDEDDEVQQPGRIVDAIVERSSQMMTSTFKKFAKPTLFRHHSTVGVSSKNDDDEVEDDSHLVVSYALKTISGNCSSSYQRITPATLCELLRLPDREFNSRFILIDCRYPFEYQGGHVKHAVNFFDRDNVHSLFFDENGKKHNKIPIFYCEFSQKRGPSMANALRSEDRIRNEAMYPHCAFEEMYVLDRGFRHFHEFVTSTNQGQFCEPFAYTQMHDLRFASELKKWNYHRRAMPGQSVLRKDATTLLTRSSVSFPSIRGGQVQRDKTPGIPRVASRRQLFADVTNSPTNFDRPGSIMMRSPSPTLLDVPLKNPQWT